MTSDRTTPSPSFAAPLACGALLMLCAFAAAADPAGVRVDAAWSRAVPPVSETAAVYVTVVNMGAEPDALVGAATPVARRVELHEHVHASGAGHDAGMMKMRKVDAVPLAPGDGVAMAPGGLHVMLMGLERPIVEGDRFPVTLRFERAPEMTVEVLVQGPGADGPAPAMQHGHGMHQGHGATTK